MRQEHRPGEKLFVDWAGATIPVYDPRTGEATQPHCWWPYADLDVHIIVEHPRPQLARQAAALPPALYSYLRILDEPGGTVVR